MATPTFMTVAVPALCLIVGLLVYALASRPEVKEIGRLSFFVGLLWLVYVFAHESVKL